VFIKAKPNAGHTDAFEFSDRIRGKSVLPVRSARVLAARWRNLAPVNGRGPLRGLHRVTAAVLNPAAAGPGRCSALGLTAL